MDLLVDTSHRSPHFADTVIMPEFVVLHYTACDLKKTLEIFTDPATKVCSHFVVDADGTIYDLGNFLESGVFRQGAHAGKSRWSEGRKIFEGFNLFSVGIEIVNLNGNIFPYPESQVRSLIGLMKALVAIAPALKSPERIVGHEDIAGFRGKCDPGALFPWQRVFRDVYPDKAAPTRLPLMTDEQRGELQEYLASVPVDEKRDQEFWTQLSSDLEKSLARSV